MTKKRNERMGAMKRQQDQAELMKERSVKRFKHAEIGESVFIPIPDVDRSKAELRNVKGVVVEIDESGMYKLGSEHGVLNHLYTRNQFLLCEEKFLVIEDVPQIKDVCYARWLDWIQLGTVKAI